MRKNLKANKGSVYIELTISMIVFMFIIVSIFELLRFAYNTVTLEYVLSRGVRQASILPENVPNRLASIKNEFITIAQSFGVTLDARNIIVRSGGRDVPNGADACNNDPTNPENAGRAHDLISICIRQRVPLFLGMTTELRSFSITKNEPQQCDRSGAGNPCTL